MHREKPQLCSRSRSGPLTSFRPGLTGDSHLQCVGVNFRTGDMLGGHTVQDPRALAAALTLQAHLLRAHHHPIPQSGSRAGHRAGTEKTSPWGPPPEGLQWPLHRVPQLPVLLGWSPSLHASGHEGRTTSLLALYLQEHAWGRV